MASKFSKAQTIKHSELMVHAALDGRIKDIRAGLKRDSAAARHACALPAGDGSVDHITPLWAAAQEGHAECVKLLIPHSNVDAKSDDDCSALFAAAQNGHVEVVRLLIAAGAAVDAAMSGTTPLFIAAQIGHAEVIRCLVKGGANVEGIYGPGATALSVAAEKGHTKSVEVLLAAGAKIEAVRGTGATPLFLAAQNGHSDVVKMLLAAGASAVAPRNDGATPISMTAQNNHLGTMKILLAAGADMNAANNYGITPIHLAVNVGSVEIVKCLLAAGVNVNALANDGTTPLFSAATFGHTRLIPLLLEAGADRDALFGGAVPAATLADVKGHTEAAQLLRNYKTKSAAASNKPSPSPSAEPPMPVFVVPSAPSLHGYSLDASTISCTFGASALIGKGSFKSVYLGSFRGDPVAVAVVDSAACPSSVQTVVALAPRWCGLRHANIVAFHGSLLHSKGLLFVSEHMAGGNLRELLKSPAPLTVARRLDFAQQLCAALDYLHEQNIVHSNLKSENCMLDKSKQVVKIGDFAPGWCEVHPTLRWIEAVTVQGNIVFKALDAPHPDPDTSVQSNIYSLGVLFHDLATRKVAFHEKSFSQYRLMENYMGCTLPDLSFVPPEEPFWRPLIEPMWNSVPSLRSSLNAVSRELTRCVAAAAAPSAASISIAAAAATASSTFVCRLCDTGAPTARQAILSCCSTTLFCYKCAALMKDHRCPRCKATVSMVMLL